MIAVPGTTIRFSFAHSLMTPEAPVKAMTDCTLQLGEDADSVVDGYAFCAKSDNFCKETGRKVSLARALQAAELPRDLRKAVWQAYFNRKSH
jgi:hypothetical protein